MNKEEAYALSNLATNSVWAKVDDKLLKPLLQRFAEEQSQKIHDEHLIHSVRLIHFFERVIEEEFNRISYLCRQHTLFSQSYSRSTSIHEQHQHILNYAKDMGSTEAELKEDAAAFSRWFGADTMHDRYTRRVSLSERKIVLCLQRLGPLIAHVVEKEGLKLGYRPLWGQLNLEKFIKPLFDYAGDTRVLVAAFHCLVKALQGLPASELGNAVESTTLQFIYRSALEKNKHIWLQYEALCLLQILSFDSLLIALKKCLTQREQENDFFLRRRVVVLLINNIVRCPDLEELLPTIVHDSSPYVRQALAQNLSKLSNRSFIQWFPQIVLQDVSPQVCAAALLDVMNALNNRYLFPTVLEVIRTVLQNNMDGFVLRVAFKTIVDGYRALIQSSPDLAEKWFITLTPELDHMHIHATYLVVRRLAAETSEILWCESVSEAKEIKEKLSALISPLPQGASVKLPKKIFCGHDETIIGRVMSVLTQRDFGLMISHGWRDITMTRGNVFGFKFWRLLHELRNSSPDKRQGFRHTIGRRMKGRIRAPSAILAELAETKVPGEPLFISSEGGYRPYLPLMDDILSCFKDPHSSVNIHTSEGVTVVQAPVSILARLKARWLLNIKFAHYAYLRNWTEQRQSKPNSYISALRKLGLSIVFKSYNKKSVDPTVNRFFSSFGIFSLSEQWDQLKNYFFSTYQNSLSDLTFFILMAIILFIGNHLYIHKKIRQARQRLPLVIGGWGTRGKSGAERLKAAMFNALGYSIVSKTTGCEAMFLLARPFGKMCEMFLFRPYDKATIWEQANLMRYAKKFDADIFLWECMALRTAYVNLIQRDWVQDDISTITNAFPDHEDIQGPAGINIPEVMAEFIPKGRCLMTTEEEMLPILRGACSELQTELLTVNWLDSGLLTPDVLARFPYNEHPSNIALVMKLGEKLGIESDFALKEMADCVVPDLGVLKTYPMAEIDTRRLIFINGMSANERFACLGNWMRMHFDTQDPYLEPGVWVSVVVNNRADRMARAQVFAKILVNDISVDKYFLIGTNLHGLMGYIQQTWDQIAPRITLWPEITTVDNVEQVLMQFAKKYRIPFLQEHVIARLRAMLVGTKSTDIDDLLSLWASPEKLSKRLSREIIEYHRQNLEALSEYQKILFEAKNTEMNQREQTNTHFRAVLERWFKRKFYVIENSYASGHQIIHDIVCNTPPGFENRMMGIQNIKGTGLDFVYRWQAWNACYLSCEKLKNKNPAIVEQGLHELSSFQNFNMLCEKYVKDVLSEIQNMSVAQQEWFRAEIKRILFNLDVAIKDITEEINSKHRIGWLAEILKDIQSILDTGNALKRRKTADRIYKDLIAERISMQRADIELQILNKAQR